MGDYFQIIVDPEVSADDAPRLAEQVREWLIERQVIEPTPLADVLGDPGHRPGPAYETTLQQPNPDGRDGGLKITVGRTVFYSIGTELTCRACQARFEPEDEAWVAAVDAWFGGDDSVTFTCPSCGKPERLSAWDGEWPWGFGNLGIEFWNWTKLSERFAGEVTKALGHRTVFVRGKL